MSIFFSNDAPTTEIYTLSLHDALPISLYELPPVEPYESGARGSGHEQQPEPEVGDRKSTRLNSSHTVISYAVFCLKKKNQQVTERSWSPHINAGGVEHALAHRPPTIAL